MRITHVVVTDAFAGVESHVCRLARAQAEAGHEVVVIGGARQDMLRAAGDQVEVLAGTSVSEARRSLAGASGRPHVVHAHMTAAEVAACLYIPVLRRQVPLVATRHFALVRGQSVAGRLVAQLIRRTVAAQISISEFTEGRIDGASRVIVAGVEHRPAPHPAANRAPLVLIASRLEPEKRVDLGVRAFAASALAEAGWRLQIAGTGSRHDEITALVTELGLNHAVDLLGHRSDVAELMANAAIFLAPTPGEHFGLSVLEAMAGGIPIVADGSGGHLESLGPTGQAGLYTSGDVDEASRKIRSLAENPALRDGYGLRLRERQATFFSLDHQVAETFDVYRSVL